MKIRKVKINNFRGIKELEWAVPETSLLCLIGKGDSSKSTLLEAIRYAFYPQWNLTIDDSDFYKANTGNAILVEITIGELPDEFCAIDRYGKYLRAWDKTLSILKPEPEDDLEDVLTVRFSVGADLEPNWEVFSESIDSVIPFKTTDRIKVCVSMIGAYTDRQLTWGKGTILSHLTEAENITSLLADTARSTRTVFENNRGVTLANFDKAANEAEIMAKELGVPVAYNYKSNLDISAINLNIGGLALHDGEIPLRKLGMGSRRMLLCGLQKKNLSRCHITLFDEIELGLEPHRITRLLKHIQNDKEGQYFITTHSPTVLRELTVNKIHVVHNDRGSVKILKVSDNNLEELNIQGTIRSSAEVFLSNKVIVCEGQTEVGLLRALDDYWCSKELKSFSFLGVSILNANGSKKIKELAVGLKLLLYDVAVVADSDSPDNFSVQDAEELNNIGVKVIMWEDGNSTEERAFLDLPWNYVQKSLKLANNEFYKPVKDNIRSVLNVEQPDNIDEWQDSNELRQAIGKAAKTKSNSWFKDITKGEIWGGIIAPVLGDNDSQSKDFLKQLNDLRGWIDYE